MAAKTRKSRRKKKPVKPEPAAKKRTRKPPPPKRTPKLLPKKRISRRRDKDLPKASPTDAIAQESPEIEPSPKESPKTEASPEYQRIKSALWQRWRALGRNEAFVWETMKLKLKFERAYKDKPDLIRQFFRPTLTVTIGNIQELDIRIRAVRDEEFRSLLKRYVDYAVRYGVVFSLIPKPPYFRVGEGQTGALGDRFRVDISEGDFAPPGGGEDAVFPDGFESDVRATPPELEALVAKRLVRYVQIDDGDRFSLLRQMFLFGYSPDRVTAFRYNSLPSYTLFLVGHNVSLPVVWPELRKVVAAEQQSSTKRDQRGAPTDVRRLQAMLNTIMRGTENQSKLASRFVKDKVSDGYSNRLASMGSRLSQLKRELEQ